jgi:hypothetical protein
MRTFTYSYEKIHETLKQVRGLASDHVCRCGEPAVDWAYQFTGEELRDVNGQRPHSADPADYAPMCRSCHIKFDLEHDPSRIEAKRESGRRLSETMAKRRRRCLQCGLVGTPGAIGNHQRWYRHAGLEDIVVEASRSGTE